MASCENLLATLASADLEARNAAWAELYGRHAPAMERWLKGRLTSKNRHLRDDIIHETFLRIERTASRRRSSFDAFLYNCLWSTTMQAIEKFNRHSHLPAIDRPKFDDHSLKVDVQDCLSQISPEDAQLLRNHVQGTCAASAAQLNIPLKTYYSRVHRALARARSSRLKDLVHP
jgi:DNA-directed RNA polymerase specialized sigma24 family protein